MKLPRVSSSIHVLLFVAAVVAVFVRIWLPPAFAIPMAALAAAVFVANLLWLLLSRNLPVVRVLLFLAAMVGALLVFFVGLFVGLQVSVAGGNILVLTAVAIVVLAIFWIVRSGKAN